VKPVTVIGRNAKIWRELQALPIVQQAAVTTLSHKDLRNTMSLAGQHVWVLSYSRNAEENRTLFQRLKELGAENTIYVSTATANVVSRTRCYRYPRVKALAEQQSRDILRARTLRIGVVYGHEAELPGGTTAATRLEDIARLIAGKGEIPQQDLINFFALVKRPFSSALERVAFDVYNSMLLLCGPWPCFLRPLDLACRAVGWRWYGYLCLSNRLWISTTSSSALA
jgi:hypothetical protein